MGFLDLILLPFYILFFHWIFKITRSRYDDPVLRMYHRNGFWIKVFSSLAFTIFNLYISPGDSTGLFHAEGVNIYNLILKDGEHVQWLYLPGSEFDETLLFNIYNTGYFSSESNAIVIKLVALFSFATLGKYVLINFLFAMIAFAGSWKLFLFFREQLPAQQKNFAIAILYMPTFVFWSSGVLKDTLCIACLGWLTYSMYDIFVNHKRVITNILKLIFFAYLLSRLKVYILISYVPIFILFIILKNMAGISNKFVKHMLAPLVIIVAIIGFGDVLKSYDEELGTYAVEGLTQSIKTMNINLESVAAESAFSLGMEYDGSVSGLVKIAPRAIGTTLFRPFLWEVHNASSLLAALESLFMLILTVYVMFRAGPLGFFKTMLQDPLIMYCFLFSIVFALFVGASSVNFGTLVRYKLPIMPFYLISIFLINAKVKKASATAIKSKQGYAEPELALVNA